MAPSLQFLGGAGTVTGSKYKLNSGKQNFLIDCGLFQGLKVLRERNWLPLPVPPSKIDAVILTHAHLDHTGYLPLLIKRGFRGKVFATAATRALCSILLPDSGFLQEEEAAFLNRHKLSKHSPALPLYTEKDAQISLNSFVDVPWEKKTSILNGLSAQYFEAGHILGAAIVQLYCEGAVVTFSGDLGRKDGLTMHPPKSIKTTDYLVVESTYGDKTHPQEDPKEHLLKIIKETIAKGGTLLIPAFAVGRAQQVLFLLSQLQKENRLPNVPVFVNSPMAIEATRIFCQFHAEQNLTPQECREMTQLARFITTEADSKNLNKISTPSIIIAASGMATGGRVVHHLKFLAPDPRHTILFSGFQAPGTRGDAIIHGAKKIKIHGEYVPVACRVEQMDTLSAHADQNEIMEWLRQFAKPPKKTFITHGEPLASEALRKKIEEDLGWECHVPDHMESVALS